MRSFVIVYHNHIIVLLDLNGMSSEVLIHLFDFQEGEGDEDGEDEGDDGEDEGWTAMETIIHCYHSFISCDSC